MASDPVMAVLHEIAERGIVPHDRKAAGIISNKTLTELVHRAGGRQLMPEEIANKLREVIPNAEKCRKAMFCERVHTSTDMNGDATATPMMETRQRGHELGTLADFRAAVSRLTLQEYGEDDEALPADYDPADFDQPDLNGWRAWQVAQMENPNGDPPF